MFLRGETAVGKQKIRAAGGGRVFQRLENIFPMVGKSGAFFPMIGKFFPMVGNFFPMVGKVFCARV
jgi:hypothetical protein